MKTIQVNNKNITLTLPEYTLFMYLYNQHGRNVTAAEINEAIYKKKTFNAYISKRIVTLQKKIGVNIFQTTKNNYKLIVNNLNTEI